MHPLAATLLALQVQVRDEPKDWKLIETANFNVYYPADELQPRAREFAAWFEKARAELADQTGVEPRRVHVYLYRSYLDLIRSSFLGSPRVQPLTRRIREPALEQGRAKCDACRPNPRARALALAEPLRDRVFIHCQASDRWNWWFVKHELAHHVQFEHLYSFRMPSWVIALKDPLTPSWFWEGGADWLAGIFDSGKDQYVRDLADERLYDLKELFYPDILNPYDYRAIYYQGSYFWRFLDEEYGLGTARKVFDRYQKLNVSSTRPVKAVTGKPREEVEREFAESLGRKWEPLMAGRGAPSERLTDTREHYRRRSWGGRWSPDGKRLAWVGDRDVWPELYVDGEGMLGWRRGIDVGTVVSAPSWSPDGKRLAVVEWTLGDRDAILLVDVEGGTETIRFAELDELYDPAWSPDGTRIAFAGLRNGTSDLYAVHLADRRLERLTNDADGESGPAWSKDGRLAWVRETEGRTRLVVDGKPVTSTWALLETPQWSPDGKSIAVAADVGGVYDAFAVDPETGKARRLTKFRGGVSYPAWHPSDGSLLLTYYQGRGQDLYRVRPEAQDEPAFEEEGRKGWYEQFRKPPPAGQAAEKTRDWGVNWLMFPVSSSSLLSPGVELSLGDRDAENTLVADAYGASGRYWSASATVANTRFRPTIGAAAIASREGDLLEAGGEPFVEVPLWTRMTTSVGWLARFRREYEDDLPDDPDFFDSGPAAAFRFSNQESYQLRDPAWGMALGGSAKVFREGLGGDRRLNEYFGFLEVSRDLAQDWIVWSRMTYEKLVGGPFLEEEILEIEDGVRGAEEREGVERGVVSLELRFPLARDFLWKPLEIIGLGEWFILKDLRGFAFGQAGFAGLEVQDAWERKFGAVGAGLGLRLDLSVMVWPIVNRRVPVRLEIWWAAVGQEGEDARGEVGFGFQLGL